MKKKLKIRKESDFATQIVLPNVKAVDLKQLLKLKNKNIVDIYKNELTSKEIRIDKPIFKKFDKGAFNSEQNK